tara:strand:+ start:1129 stop:1977 length:849 start_codon:yes stop_codon:yes gene_type:complete
MHTINSLLNEGFECLSKNSIKSSRLESEILLSHILNKDPKYLILNHSNILKNDQVNSFIKLIQRRKLGEPIAYILKKKEFWKYDFYVNKNVMIPRPDSEIIIEQSLKLIKKNEKKKILDIGTGSGCLIISLLNERKKLYGDAIDISKKALNVAKFNAKIHNLQNRIKFYESSVDKFFKGKYDLILSNPPYISSLSIKYLEKDIIDFEPKLALEGGLDGSLIFKKVIKKSSNLIKVGGKLVLEIGFDQKQMVMKLLKNEGFYINKTVKDYGNNDRCIISTKNQ